MDKAGGFRHDRVDQVTGLRRPDGGITEKVEQFQWHLLLP
jgi:hypothetical protein